MENIKQYQISFEKGITNVPSDVLCSDNEAAELVGMTFENGELKPIQDGYNTGSVEQRILYVHKAGTNTMYISFGNPGVYAYTYTNGAYSLNYEVDTTLTSVKDVKAIGNTLIINTDSGMIYYLWNGNGYTKLGDKIPEPDVKLKLYDAGTVTDTGENSSEVFRMEQGNTVLNNHQLWNDFVYGFYAKLKKDANNLKGFTMPFAARYALELYDGTLIYHSSPILFFPARTKNFSMKRGWMDNNVATWYVQMQVSTLRYACSSDYSNWADIVKGVKLYISDEIDIYDTSSDAEYNTITESFVYNDYIKVMNDNPLTAGMQLPGEITLTPSANDAYCNPMRSLSFNDIVETLAENSLFYELCSLDNTSGVFKQVTGFKVADLKNITTRTQMTGEYYSHCKYIPNYMYSYNGRLHIADFSRSVFEGYSHFTGHDLPLSGSVDTYTIYVTIKTSDGNRVVAKTITATTERIGAFFFYPDPRAYSVTIYSANNLGYFTKELKEHPGLNGAYYIDNPLNNISWTSGTPSVVANTTPEAIYNKILVSEVDNPFVFSLNGYVTVGNGRIMGMAANTAALGQGQFGQHPLFVFSSDGIWALSTNATGTYTSVHPFSREVCNNNKSITQTDNAIFFSSAKGLMVIAGNSVKCVSEQMNGKKLDVEGIYGVPSPVQDNTSFKDYLKTCEIVYDYKDSQLWLIGGQNYHYVFNMNGGTISKVIDPYHIFYTVDNYPDSLIQIQGNTGYNVLSLLNKPDINTDANVYDGYILTRPIKFKSVLSLKSIRQMKHIMFMDGPVTTSSSDPEAKTFSVKLFASNNCKQWVELHSLRGKPWKYYRMAYTLTNMKATDRFAGTVFFVEERRTEKLR